MAAPRPQLTRARAAACVRSAAVSTMSIGAADVILIITAIVAFLLMIAGSIYFIVYFQHPDDKVERRTLGVRGWNGGSVLLRVVCMSMRARM